MKHLYIIRHGQTAFNVQRIVQGKGVDSSLDETGRAQSLAFHRAYRHLPFDAVLTSTLRRTQETVQPFLEQGLPHYAFPELDEIGWGLFEGKPADDALKQVHREVLRQWSDGNYHAAVPEGESALSMQERLHRWLQQVRSLPHSHLLICTHGGVLAFLMTILKNEPLSQMPLYRHRNTGLCHFFFDGEDFELKLQDDCSHWE